MSLNSVCLEESKNNLLTIARDKSAAIKGVLLSLVILGHNHFFVKSFSDGCWLWLYSFHVSGFFILPFFYSDHPISLFRVWINCKRLLWPYTYMFAILFLVNWLVLKKASLDMGLLYTYVTGNFYELRNYTGFQYLWFLPAMFSMIVIKDVYASSKLVIRRTILLLGLFCFIVFGVFLYNQPYNKCINTNLASYSIISVMMGLSMFFIGKMTKCFLNKTKFSTLLYSALLVVTMMGMILSYGNSMFIYISWFSRILCPIIVFGLLFNGGGIMY